MKHTTMKEVAEKLGVSASTVSRALRNHPNISVEVKKQVNELVEKLNYQPNPIARSLKMNRTNTIGVLVPFIRHDFLSSVISGIEEITYKAGYTILLTQSSDIPEREILSINTFLHHRVAGVIASISSNTTNDEHFRSLLHRKIPLVFFDRVCPNFAANKVVIDDFQSAFKAVTYLISKGRKKIAHFAGPQNLDIYEKRQAGYIEALKCAGIPVIKDLILEFGLFNQSGYCELDQLLKKGIVPDAIFAVSDSLAIGAYRRIREANLSIPEDIALIGFSNMEISNLVVPSLSTIEQHPYEMGKLAAEILIKSIGNDSSFLKPETVVLNSELILRESV